MPNSDGLNIERVEFDETWNPFKDFDWLKWDVSSYYPTAVINPKWKATYEGSFKLDKNKPMMLTKCIDCRYCIKPRDGNYRCKYSIHDGKPERETCNYERKKR